MTLVLISSPRHSTSTCLEDVGGGTVADRLEVGEVVVGVRGIDKALDNGIKLPRLACLCRCRHACVLAIQLQWLGYETRAVALVVVVGKRNVVSVQSMGCRGKQNQ